MKFFTFAHEIGDHQLHHFTVTKPRRTKELEADEYAGWALAASVVRGARGRVKADGFINAWELVPVDCSRVACRTGDLRRRRIAGLPGKNRTRVGRYEGAREANVPK